MDDAMEWKGGIQKRVSRFFLDDKWFLDSTSMQSEYAI